MIGALRVAPFNPAASGCERLSGEKFDETNFGLFLGVDVMPGLTHCCHKVICSGVCAAKRSINSAYYSDHVRYWSVTRYGHGRTTRS